MDALGIGAKPFSIGHVLVSGGRLVRSALPVAVGVSVLMVLASFATNYLPFFKPDLVAVRAEGLPAAFLPWLLAMARALMLGTLLHGVLLVQMAGAAQGQAISGPVALWRSATAYPRLFSAQLTAIVLTSLGAVACGLPGLYAAVVLSLVFPVAYLDPDSAVVETSAELTRGRRWQILVLLLLTRGFILGTTMVSGAVVTGLARAGVVSVSTETISGMVMMNLAMDLVRELAVSFDVALMLAAYLSLRSDRERALEALVQGAKAPSTMPAPASAPATLFRST